MGGVGVGWGFPSTRLFLSLTCFFVVIVCQAWRLCFWVCGVRFFFFFLIIQSWIEDEAYVVAGSQ